MRPSLIVLATVLAAGSAQGAEVYAGIGKGLNQVLIQSGSIASSEAAELGLAVDLPWRFSLSDTGDLGLKMELAAACLRGDHRGQSDRLEIYALRPVLHWQPGGRGFLEVGLGVAHLSSDHYEEIRMAKKDNFSVMVGGGYQLDQAGHWQAALRYNHYSNGYTATPNPGLDYAIASLSYRF